MGKPHHLDIIDLESNLILASKIISEFRKEIYSDPIVPDVTYSELYEKLNEEIPENDCDMETLFEEIKTDIMPNFSKIGHPRNLAWMNNSSCDAGIIGEVLSVGFGQVPFMFDGSPIGTVIENLVVRWFGELFGYKDEFGGTLTSGGMMANLTALTVARTITGQISFEDGMMNEQERLVLYVSEQGHSTIERAVGMLGIGSKNLRRISVDGRLKMNVDELVTSIEHDLEEGLKPFCVVGQCGSAAAGAIDPLKEIAAVCSKYNLWFHVDAAYGGGAILTERYKEIFKRISSADSITVDPHKWFYMPLEAGMILVKNKEHLYRSFNGSACSSYKGENDENNIMNYGVQYARSSKAFKIWFALKFYGTRRITQMVEKNILQAKYLKQKLNNYSCWRLLNPVELSIVAFQFYPEGEYTDEVINELQKKIILRLKLDSIAFLTHVEINNRVGIRMCFANHRTTIEDIDLIITAIKKIGLEIINS